MWFLLILLGIFVGLLGTKVILSVATLFELDFITELGYLKIYGLISLIQLINYKHTDEIQGEDITKESFNRIRSRVALYLTFWGISFFMYWVISNFGG